MGNKWTKEETIVAFNVYCKIPFKNSSKSHPLIVTYADLLGRTPSALNMKIGNIGRLDPSLQEKGITGLRHGAKMDEDIWNEFSSNPEKLAYESEQIIARLSEKKLEDSLQIDISAFPEGEERETVIRQRINQAFFRNAVLSAYNFKCCISGIKSPELLDACHIVDWAQDKANRMNPSNGLCLNSLFHKAYDKYLIAITPDLDVVVSERMLQNAGSTRFGEYLKEIDGNKISVPEKFFPKKEFLERHYNDFRRVSV